MQKVILEGAVRETLGKTSSVNLRKEGLVPCVVYGGKETIHFTAPQLAFRPIVYTPDFSIVELNVGGKKIDCIKKDVQFDPLTDSLTHVDFLELNPGRAFKCEVPLIITGNSTGVRKGGKLTPKVRRVLIKATVEKLVTSLTIDVTELDLGRSLRIRDISAPEGIEILNAPAIPVVTIDIPRALRSAQAEEAKAKDTKKK